MLKLVLKAVFSGLRSRQSMVLENIALRHQLEVLRRNAKTPRLKARDRLLWVILSRFWTCWRRNLVLVQPKTVIGWHRKGWRLYWKWKSQPKQKGRPRVSVAARQLIRRISRENPLWGAPHIHGELLKLGIEVSEATVARYIIKGPRPRSQTWQTFIRNHLSEMVAVDFFTVHTATFKTLYVFVVLALGRHQVIHFNVTDSPTAAWTSLQLTQAFPFDTAPRFLIRDSDRIYGRKVVDTLKAMDIQQVVISYHSPWQSGHIERLIGSIRRECMDQVIIFNERHLRRILRQYITYYHESRTHLGLEKDCPVHREMQSREMGQIVSYPVLGGLHHTYSREAA